MEVGSSAAPMEAPMEVPMEAEREVMEAAVVGRVAADPR